MAEKKYLDNDGLSHFWLLLKEKLTGKVDKEFKTGSQSEYKVLSDNNLTNELLEKINNAGDSSFTGNYEDLSNKPDLTVYALKTQVAQDIATATTDMATKSYVTQQLANINKKQVVSSTTEMTDTNTIYLLAVEGGENNVYEEYIVYNGKAEKIGTTQVDLTGYVREEDLIAITNGEIDEIVV